MTVEGLRSMPSGDGQAPGGSAQPPTKPAAPLPAGAGWTRWQDRIGAFWSRLTLAQKFVITAAGVLLLGMSAIGTWVTAKIEQGVTNNSAIAATLYMDAFIGPLVQDLARSGNLSAESIAKLDAIMNQSELKDYVVSIKVWKSAAQVAYSNFHDVIGKTFTPTIHLTQAWKGIVSADLDGHSHDDDHNERELNMPLLEIYAPIRETGSSRIIGVSEFYVRADKLIAALATARIQSWGVVGATALLMMLALHGLVRSGSNTIEAQQRDLIQKATQNAALRDRIEAAYWRADLLNEQFLRRLGADLHDGPAQLIGFALMTLDDLPASDGPVAPELPSTHDAIRSALEDAIRDIRSLSRGLMLPELESMSLNEAAALIIKMHEDRTGTKVEAEIPVRVIDAANEVKVCAYRFLQEGLNNAYKHAAGEGQRVLISCELGYLRVTVSDNGPGPEHRPNDHRHAASRLGLTGVRDRVETLKGRFEMRKSTSGGTTVAITLKCRT